MSGNSRMYGINCFSRDFFLLSVSICLYTLWNSRLFLVVALLSCSCYLVVSLESLQSTLQLMLFSLLRF